MVDAELVAAVDKALKGSKERKFLESVELTFNLKDIDLSVPKNRVDVDIALPHGRGKNVKVALFSSTEMAMKAKGVADVIIKPEEMEELGKSKKNMKKLATACKYFLAEAPLMPVIGKKLGTVLGPRGKMPRPVPPGSDPSVIIKGLRNTIKVRSKDRITFHAPIGTKDMGAEKLAENIEMVIDRVQQKLEKGKFNIRSIFVKTTMGPAVRVK
jgi:large subunit ribosomal protein L1